MYKFDEFEAFCNEAWHSLGITHDIETGNDSSSHVLENRNWSWNHLKKELRTRNLESLYLRYRQILHQGYFSVFLLLQMLITAIHVGCLLIKEIDDPQHKSLPDIISYVSITLLLWPMVAVVLDKHLVKKYPFIPLIISCFTVAIVVIVDIALPIYHTSVFHSRIPLRPAYATHALLACYVFLPLSNNSTPIILGLGITLSYILTLVMVTYRNSNTANKQILSEIVFFFCINGMGLYHRLLNEIIIRRAFLDRRSCIEFIMKLNSEKEQEEQLLLSILPKHIAARVKEDIRRKSERFNHVEEIVTMKPFKELYIEKHDNVSILYADIVNYTKMTSSLPVNKLVETLNELFGKFDEASERHNVLRIKFLGDCYYCAAGVPQPNPDHAKCCVSLALDMITIIKEVRRERKLDVDMRIGIHSGSILSGLLGKCKWQYDIWSKDVIIANRMEQSGMPGTVHITKQTLDLLGDEYVTEPGNGHLRDEFLAKYNIKTYLLKPREELKGIISSQGAMTVSRRKTAFMNKNLIIYQQRLKMADVYMEKAMDNLPAGKNRFFSSTWFQYTKLHSLCLTFGNECAWELPFMKQPDPLFKFYIISALFVSVCMCAMHFWEPPRLYFFSNMGFTVSTTGLICFLPLTWSHYIWNAVKDPKQRMERIPEPKNKIILFLYKISVKIIWNCYLRTFLYLVVCFLLTACSLADFMNQVYPLYPNEAYSLNTGNKTQGHSLWRMTESCYLVVLMSFFFNRIHFQLKLFVGMLVLIVYSCGVLIVDLDSEDETWNPNLEPKIAHILSLLFLVLDLHLMDRQDECTNRLDYLWKRQLSHEKDEAEKTRSVNLMLLHNILPIHVAKVYLNTSRASNDLYHENYDCISVMFASLTNYFLYHDKDIYQSEIKSIEILNKVICDFDDALSERRFRTVEKIKVAGSTYMAACGLHPGQTDSDNTVGLSATKVVLVLVEFAASVMRRLQKINREFHTDFKLRVGISHGPVTAGVVGSQKPLYDIWGNAVNIASRMDSTGEPGKIQVTASTAIILLEEGISCSFRGPTVVKGKGIMDTYFISLTDDFYIRKKTVTGI